MPVREELLAKVNTDVQAFISGDARSREAAAESCRALAASPESPSEAIIQMTWNEVRSSAMADWKAQSDVIVMTAESPCGPSYGRRHEHVSAPRFEHRSIKSSAELAEACKAEPWLVGPATSLLRCPESSGELMI
jgi:hypothetical protein